MQENTLLLLSLFFAFAGISVLFLIAKNVPAVEMLPDEVSGESAGVMVLVKGRVVALTSSGGFDWFLLCSSKCISVVDFESDGVREGNVVSVEGVVREYKGGLEIIAEEIEILAP